MANHKKEPFQEESCWPFSIQVQSISSISGQRSSPFAEWKWFGNESNSKTLHPPSHCMVLLLPADKLWRVKNGMRPLVAALIAAAARSLPCVPFASQCCWWISYPERYTDYLLYLRTVSRSRNQKGDVSLPVSQLKRQHQITIAIVITANHRCFFCTGDLSAHAVTVAWGGLPQASTTSTHPSNSEPWRVVNNPFTAKNPMEKIHWDQTWQWWDV